MLLLVAGVTAGAVALLRVGGDVGTPSRPFVGGDLHSLVADPRDPSTIYVGGHEGVAVSHDAGATWHRIESLDDADAMAWAFEDGRILVGGHPGLFVSDGGAGSFEPRNEGLPSTDVHALGSGGRVIYAASPAVGVFASTDGGVTWEVRSGRVGQAFMGRILVDPQDHDHLIASDMQYGAVESVDGGRTWKVLGGFPGAMWVSWDPANTRHVVVSGMSGAAESTDGGRTWNPLRVEPRVSVVEMSPRDPEILFAAALEGTTAVIWVSRDRGATWGAP